MSNSLKKVLLTILVFLPAVCAQTLTISQRDIPLIADVDVLVAGGWSGGVAAAVEAAKNGASVYLITPDPYLGGDIAGTWRFWPDSGELVYFELAKKAFKVPSVYSDKLLPFEYEFDKEPAGQLTDENHKRLKDGSLFGSHCLQFNGDVNITLDLQKSTKFDTVNLWVNQMYPDCLIEKATVSVSSDKQDWKKIYVIENKSPGFYKKEPLRLNAEVNSQARYVRINIEKKDKAKVIGIAEIQLFNKKDMLNVPVVSPLQIKKTFDDALLNAGVEFLFSTYCTDILFDSNNMPCGVLVSNRSGRQAIKAKVIIDATSRGTVARLAGAKFTDFPAGKQMFRFMAIGGVNKTDEKNLIVSAKKMSRPLISRGKPYYPVEYWLSVDMKDGSFASINEAEQKIRSVVWADEMVRTGDIPWQIWPDHLISEGQSDEFKINSIDVNQFIPDGFRNLYVLSSCADMSRESAGRMMEPPAYMKVGSIIGKAAASVADKIKIAQSVQIKKSVDGDSIKGDLKELLEDVRPGKTAANTIKISEHIVPIDGEYDVVVIGGGTAGAPATIASAIQGAKTLVVEYLHTLGGIGTEGRIANYWYGNLTGFSLEADKSMGLPERKIWEKPVNRVWNPIQKAEWWRKEVIKSGADVWFGAIGCGAIVENNQVKGVLIATPDGPKYILAKCVVDATGSADIAIAGGSSYMFVNAESIAYQGAGLPPTDIGINYFNTDFAIVDDLDTVDTTHFRVYSKNRYKDAFDISSLICTRERRRIIGDFVMTVEDQLMERTYPDAIAKTYSNYDSHGSKSALWYFLMPRPDKQFCYLPFRCMLPKGLNGIIVTGTGISVQHDALAILRMQADMQNEGYAAGAAAAMACRNENSVRGIDVKTLQKHLVEKGNISSEVLNHTDNSKLSKEEISKILPTAAHTKNAKEVASLMVNADTVLPLAKKAYGETSDKSEKLFYANFMALYGEPAGIDTIIETLEGMPWDKGGGTLSMSEVDRLVISAGLTKDKKATDAVLNKMKELNLQSPFSHFQAIALALQSLKDSRAAEPLAKLLQQKGMTGHYVTTITEAAEQDCKAMEIQPNEFSLDTRMLCDRELILARALLYSGDSDGIGRKILENYTRDIRGVYAAAAEASLNYAEKLNVNADTIITGETATNPPFFNWKPVGPAILEYSPDINFSKNVHKVNVKYNFYTPQEFLATGKWYWRINKDGKYSEAGCIVIPEKVHQFISPPIDANFVLAKPRPRLISREKLNEKQQADLLAEFRVIADWKVPANPPAYKISEWRDVYQFYSQVQRMQVMPTGKRLQRMAEIYAQLGDEEIRNTLNKWLDEIMQWDLNGGSSPQSHGDIPSYHILRGLNYCYDVLYNDMPEAKKRQLRDIIIVRATAFEGLLGNPFPVGQHKEYNNHAWLRTLVLGESGIVLLGDYERAYEWAEYAKELLTGKYLCGLGFQGENNEGLAYWAYGGQFLFEQAVLIRQVASINLFEHPWLKNTARFALYCAPKNSWAVSFADMGTPNHFFYAAKKAYKNAAKGNYYIWKEQPVMSRVEYFTKKLAKECGDPYAMWYSKNYDAPVIAPKPPVDIEPSVHYEHIGWAILNTNLVDGEDGVTFAMRSGVYWEGHQHADENNYVINAYGSKLAIDSGYYDYYGGRHFLEYSTQTKAHNAILVNGEGQAWRKIGADGKIDGYFDSPTYGIVIGDASDKDIYAGKIDTWLRKAIFIKPGLVVLNDEIIAKEPSQYDWLLHTVANIETDSNDNSFRFTSGNAVMQGCFLMPEKPAMAVTFGYPVLPTGLDDAKIKPEDVVYEWTLKVQPTEKKKDEHFVSIMQIDRADNQRSKPQLIKLQDDNDVLVFKVILDGDIHLICFNSAGKTFDTAGMNTNAEITVLSFDKNEQLQKYMIYNGSFLKFKNKNFFEANLKINVSCKYYDNENSILDLQSDSDAEVRFYSALNTKIYVDGNYSKSNKDEYSMALAKGRHIIGIGNNPAKHLAGKIEGLDFNGGRLEGYKTRSENQRNYYWWSRFNCEQSGKYIVKCSSPNKSNNIRVYIDDDIIDLSGLKSIGLDKGVHFIQISSTSEIDSIELVRETVSLEERK